MFPRYSSHCRREDAPHRQYLSPKLNLHRMYELYVVWCADNSRGAAKEHKYRDIFNHKFNLSFHPSLKEIPVQHVIDTMICLNCQKVNPMHIVTLSSLEMHIILWFQKHSKEEMLIKTSRNQIKISRQ